MCGSHFVGHIVWVTLYESHFVSHILCLIMCLANGTKGQNVRSKSMTNVSSTVWLKAVPLAKMDEFLG